MAESKEELRSSPEHRPLYPISIAAEIIGVHERTLYFYEREGLLIPSRRGSWRFFSDEDLAWIKAIRYLIHERGLNAAGLRRMLALIPCWEITNCAPEQKASCPKPATKSIPCWLLSVKKGNRCNSCQVYQLARQHICDDEELEWLKGNQE